MNTTTWRPAALAALQVARTAEAAIRLLPVVVVVVALGYTLAHEPGPHEVVATGVVAVALVAGLLI
ncbi:MAG: hypothetical protein QM655_16610, partial [Nocardioidaceae bacterium]